MSESKANKPVPEKATAKDTSRTPALAADKQKPAKPAPAKKREPGGSNSALWLSLLSLAASIALAVAAFFFWNQQQQFLQGKNTVEKRVENKLQEVDATIRRVKTDFDDLKTLEQQNRGELTDKFAQFNETQRAQSDRINKLNSLVGRSTQDWAMAEVEYLLRLASDRVQLQRDVKTALVALNNADQRLLEFSDPGLSKVRQQIADEIDQLKRVPVIDREGFAASLSALLARLDRLPLDRQVYQAVAAEQAGNDASEKAIQDQPVKLDWKSWQDWQKIPAMIGEALRKLVTIREHDQPVQPMMQPGSEIFLRQNLRLQIEAARLALLREDAVFYLQALDTAKAWIEKYFAQDSDDVKATLEQLNELGSVQIHPVMPDISKSLRILRERMDLSDRATATTEPAQADQPSAAESTTSEPEAPTGQNL